jgi:hypothetical protein
MKRILLILALIAAFIPVRADEGMWLPYLLGEKVYREMVRKGLKLSKEQLYSVNNASVKDAIILFNGGCTGGVVSAEGLIFTNQHCAFAPIAGSSNNGPAYLMKGFFAHKKEADVPVPGLYVQVLVTVADVTPAVEKGMGSLSGEQKTVQEQAVMRDIVAAATKGTGYEAQILPVFNGNQYLLFVYERYNDIRLVGTPPQSIGSFGALSDNWEWPRHSADFSIFRVYTGRNGTPAAYNAGNIPMKPKYVLPISLRGVKENDYTMILGYPASTNRYEYSSALRLKMEAEDPFVVTLSDIKLKYISEQMEQHPEMKQELIPFYAMLNNYRKFFEGEARQLIRPGIIAERQAEEAAFQRWAKGGPYEPVLAGYQQLYREWAPYVRYKLYLSDGLRAPTAIDLASNFGGLEQMLRSGNSSASEVKDFINLIGGTRNAFNRIGRKGYDVKILAATCHAFYNNIPKELRAPGFFEDIGKRYGDPEQDSTYQHWAADVMDSTLVFNDGKWKVFTGNPDANLLRQDPAFRYYSVFTDNYEKICRNKEAVFSDGSRDLRARYLKGRMTMQPGKNWYPDANATLRLSYGNVKSYEPADAVKYNYACTMKGVLEKYRPGDIEFDLSEKYRALYSNKDFGRYKDAVYNDIVTSFITTNDITGGNSGSPVLNGKGEMVGLLFDGNYEGIAQKLYFNPSRNRAVCVDVRYILWCIEKLGEAPNIVKELKLVN